MRYTFDSINALARDVHPDFRVCSYNTTWMLSVRVNEYGGHRTNISSQNSQRYSQLPLQLK